MTKDSSKLCYALLTFYTKLFHDRYGRKPVVNLYKEKWAMNDVIDSVGFDRAKELLEYYFKVNNPSHNLTWFFYNFDRMDEMFQKSEEDKERRARIREKTKQMVEESE